MKTKASDSSKVGRWAGRARGADWDAPCLFASRYRGTPRVRVADWRKSLDALLLILAALSVDSRLLPLPPRLPPPAADRAVDSFSAAASTAYPRIRSARVARKCLEIIRYRRQNFSLQAATCSYILFFLFTLFQFTFRLITVCAFLVTISVE